MCSRCDSLLRKPSLSELSWRLDMSVFKQSIWGKLHHAWVMSNFPLVMAPDHAMITCYFRFRRFGNTIHHICKHKPPLLWNLPVAIICAGKTNRLGESNLSWLDKTHLNIGPAMNIALSGHLMEVSAHGRSRVDFFKVVGNITVCSCSGMGTLARLLEGSSYLREVRTSNIPFIFLNLF